MNLTNHPIFVVGFPRSGTTLLQSLICTQGIVSFPETHYFRLLKKYLPLNSEGKIIAFKQEIKSFTEVSLNHFDNDDIINGRINNKQIFEFIITQLSEKGTLEKRWLEKTPAHLYAYDYIKKLYPEAKFVFIMRAPLDAIASCKQNIHEDKTWFELARRWKGDIRLAEEIKRKSKDALQIIKYEDLAQNTIQTLREICKFLDIKFEEDNVNSFNSISNQFIMPFEKWKKQNTSKLSYKPQKFLTEYSFIERLQIQYYLIDEIRTYNYNVFNPFSLKMYLAIKKIQNFFK